MPVMAYMRAICACFVIAVCIAALITGAKARDAVSIADGVFSEAQSRRGEMQYLKICKRCHERNLMGGGYDDIPPLIGEEFLSNWMTWTVGDLFDFMQNDMPPKRKDRVGITADSYADILAYILEKNGFPKGTAELPAEFEPLTEIEMSPSD